jgi:hypothetical protein
MLHKNRVREKKLGVNEKEFFKEFARELKLFFNVSPLILGLLGSFRPCFDRRNELYNFS